MSTEKIEQDIVDQALAKAKRAMLGVFGFSFVVNLLLLTSPIFMLQVYDRVLMSRSESTLLGLLSVAVFLLLLLLVIEVVRNYLMNRISVRFDKDISKLTLSEVLSRGNSSKAMHDVNSIRSFLNAPYLLALFDIPWLPLYLGLVYFLHPVLGHLGLLGAVILFALAVMNDRLTRQAAQKANEAFGAANEFVEHSHRNKGAVLGMGMLPGLMQTWSTYQDAGMGFHIKASDSNAMISALAKVIRQVIQVTVLAAGGYLAIQDITSPGVMIAASIIIGRALAPIEQSIQGWRSFTKVKSSYLSLKEFMATFQTAKPATPLPVPQGNLQLSHVLSLAGQASADDAPPKPIIKNLSLSIKAGEAVGMTGPSGSGKSTIARLMLGILQPLSGTVRVDGAELQPEVQKQFSAYFGYLPQEVELFDGTVAENIARFRYDNPEGIVEAAKLAGAHEMILSLANGYETKVGPSGENLSGGQRQRIGFARALYGDPCLVVLDEPTSNLDNEGRLALLAAVDQLKEKGTTIVLIAHQPGLFKSMDKIALVAQGQIQQYGPLDEVMPTLKPKSNVTKSVDEKLSQPAVSGASPQVKVKQIRKL